MTLQIEFLISLILIAILMSSALAPLESLTWWAGWFGEEEELDELDREHTGTAGDAIHARAYIVYLTGIGGFSENSFLPREQRLLDELTKRLDNVVVVDDIYPYSVTNNGLIDHRIFSGFWNWTVRQKEAGRPLGFLINIRNVLQVLVAADNRYGPLYAHGIAQVVFDGLLRNGYQPQSKIPIYLIGYSGGGEMSISAVGPLMQSSGAPVTVISLGGVMSSDPNLEDIEHLYHLHGEKDRVHKLGPLLFPGRWRWITRSSWNQAMRDNRITMVSMGDMAHNGPGGYLDNEAFLASGESYLDKTLATIHDIVTPDKGKKV